MKLVWTKKALDRMSDILKYIEEEFGEKARKAFRVKAHQFTQLLAEFPEMGKLEVKEKNIRAFQLTRQTRVFYRIKNEKIIILTFFDSRQNPKKKPR